MLSSLFCKKIKKIFLWEHAYIFKDDTDIHTHMHAHTQKIVWHSRWADVTFEDGGTPPPPPEGQTGKMEGWILTAHATHHFSYMDVEFLTYLIRITHNVDFLTKQAGFFKSEPKTKPCLVHVTSSWFRLWSILVLIWHEAQHAALQLWSSLVCQTERVCGWRCWAWFCLWLRERDREGRPFKTWKYRLVRKNKTFCCRAMPSNVILSQACSGFSQHIYDSH